MNGAIFATLAVKLAICRAIGSTLAAILAICCSILATLAVTIAACFSAPANGAAPTAARTTLKSHSTLRRLCGCVPDGTCPSLLVQVVEARPLFPVSRSRRVRAAKPGSAGFNLNPCKSPLFGDTVKRGVGVEVDPYKKTSAVRSRCSPDAPCAVLGRSQAPPVRSSTPVGRIPGGAA